MQAIADIISYFFPYYFNCRAKKSTKIQLGKNIWYFFPLCLYFFPLCLYFFPLGHAINCSTLTGGVLGENILSLCVNVYPLAMLYGIYFAFLLGYELKEKQYNISPLVQFFSYLWQKNLLEKMNGGKKNGIFSPFPYFSPLDHAVFGSPS